MRKLLKDCLYILFVVTILFFISDQPSFSRTIKFAQVSDIHYSKRVVENGYKLLDKTQPLLEDAVMQINNEKNIDFVMITGDFIDKPLKESFDGVTQILNELKYPWYLAVGNHDTTTDGYLTKKNLLQELKFKNKNYTFNSTYYTFKKYNYRIIVLDGAKNQGISSHGILPQEELLWLNNVLKRSKKDVVLIFIHFPLVAPFNSPNHEILNANEFKKILDQYKMPIAIFSGHYHMTKITKKDNILHVSTPSLAGYPNAFRIVEVNNKRNKVIFNFKFIETNLKDVQAKTRILTLGGARYYGKEKDRNTTITIDKK
ncbi:MAG: hypothetical protein E7Z90_03085 [Cyanobacteria bacterium SIG29]|nr:hypothetical protein [Cyanobacteria bacterium SIG29]